MSIYKEGDPEPTYVPMTWAIVFLIVLFVSWDYIL